MPQRFAGGHARDVRVWLPPSYELPTARARRYPVIVFLHGWPGSEGNWPGQGRAGETLGRLIANGQVPELIGVFPDGAGSGLLGRSIWLDSWDGRSRLETFLVRDLPAWLDSVYRTRATPSHRGVIGLSDGGMGAFNLVIRHPEVYGAAGAHSADFLLTTDFSDKGLLGPEPGASRMRADYSPLLTVVHAAARLDNTALYVDCGMQDESLPQNRAFHARLDSLGVAHTYHEFPGSHDWAYWRTHLEESLKTVTARMR